MIPDYQTLMAPVLRQVMDGKAHPVKEIAAALALEFGLTPDELGEMLPSGRITVWRSRVHWATQYLYQAGAIARSRRGVFTITARGRQLLTSHPDRVGNAQLEQFAEFRDFKARSHATNGPQASSQTAMLTDQSAQELQERSTPYDRIKQAADEANAVVAAELLTRINEQPPVFLERVVLDLLVAMGYTGARGNPEHLGRSGDEGLDGVLNQDALGLDRIYVQAKRYASGKTVGRPEIQGFVGALHGAQASRGVFITTSKFSPDAREYVRYAPQRLVLIDGHELSQLMVRYDVGVQTEQTVTVKRVDEDFFE